MLTRYLPQRDFEIFDSVTSRNVIYTGDMHPVSDDIKNGEIFLC
jgi:hypothetical protein